MVWLTRKQLATDHVVYARHEEVSEIAFQAIEQ